MLTDKAVQFRIGLQCGTGLDFVFDERLECVLAENLAGQADTIAKLLPVLVLRHVVEKDLWIIRRIAGRQCDGPARGGPHRTNMGLKPMPFGCGLAIIAHRDRQEVILDIGVFDTGFGPDKGGRFKLVRRAHASFGEQPLRPDHRLREDIPMLVERDGLACRHLDVQLKMVLQVLTDTRAVRHNVDPVFRQMGRRANARQHQQLGRIDRRRGQYHLATGAQHFAGAAAQHLYTHRAAIFDHDALRQRADHLDIARLLGRPQIGIRR